MEDSPQKENGYTSIAHEIIEAICRFDGMSAQELRLVLLLIRKTYGFHKKETTLTLNEMACYLNIQRTRCSTLINDLELMKIVTVTENVNGRPKKYKFNKHYNEWSGVTKKYKSKKNVTVIENNEKGLQKSEIKGYTPEEPIPYKDRSKDNSKIHGATSRPKNKDIHIADPRIKKGIDYFSEQFTKIHGYKPNIEDGKDGYAVKKLLALIDKSGEDNHSALFADLVKLYLASNNVFIVENGFKLSLLPGQYNALMLKRNGHSTGGNGKKRDEEPIRPRLKEFIPVNRRGPDYNPEDHIE